MYTKQSAEENRTILNRCKRLLKFNSPRSVEATIAGDYPHATMKRVKSIVSKAIRQLRKK